MRPGLLPPGQLQSAIDRHGHLFFPAGVYVTGDIRLRDGVSLIGEHGSVFLQHDEAHYLFSINPGNEGSPDLRANIRNVSLSELTFRGQSDKLGFSEHRHLLNFNGCSHVQIRDCLFEAFRGDGIYLGSGNQPGLERHNSDIVIERCGFDGMNSQNRNGVSIIDGTRVRISECRFDRCSRPDMPGAIDIEPDDNPVHVIRNIEVNHNSIIRCGGGVGAISLILPACGFHTPPRGIQVHDNSIDGNGNSSGITAKQYCAAESHDISSTITIRRNQVRNTDRPFVISGVAGADLIDNHFEVSRRSGALSLPAHAPAMAFQAARNAFLRLGLEEGVGLKIHPTRGVHLIDNRFVPPVGSGKWTAIDIELAPGNALEVRANRFENRLNGDTAALRFHGANQTQLAAFLAGNHVAHGVHPWR